MSNPYNDKAMADYWIKIIRENRDAFREFVTNPSLFEKIDSLDEEIKILDAGCGEGYVSRYAASKGHKVTGIDLSQHLIDAAKELSSPNETYLCSNIQNLDLENESYDAVVSNFMLMELESPSTAIREISRILKPGGRFIFQGLHPFCYASNSGKTEGKNVQDYFKSQKHSEKFVVDGLESPKEGIRYHHPLSTYTNSLRENGFVIFSLDEPQPIESTPKDSPIIEIFKDPWILLIDAYKK